MANSRPPNSHFSVRDPRVESAARPFVEGKWHFQIEAARMLGQLWNQRASLPFSLRQHGARHVARNDRTWPVSVSRVRH
jgi:hypothetical protein